MSGYLLQFQRDMAKINDICNELDKESDIVLTSAVDNLCASLELASKGYVLWECRDTIDKELAKAKSKITITNRRLKEFLIRKYGHAIEFFCAYRKSELEMFFSTDIHQGELVMKIWSTDVVSKCAKILGERRTKTTISNLIRHIAMQEILLWVSQNLRSPFLRCGTNLLFRCLTKWVVQW